MWANVYGRHPRRGKEGEFLLHEDAHTHHDLAQGVLNGLQEIIRLVGASIKDIDYIIHGTTIGTNAIVEGNGARVGLITTAGF